MAPVIFDRTNITDSIVSQVYRGQRRVLLDGVAETTHLGRIDPH